MRHIFAELELRRVEMQRLANNKEEGGRCMRRSSTAEDVGT